MIIFDSPSLHARALTAAYPIIATIFHQQINNDEDVYTSALCDVLGNVRDGLTENNLMMVQIDGQRIEMVHVELRRERGDEETVFDEEDEESENGGEWADEDEEKEGEEGENGFGGISLLPTMGL